MKDYSKSILIEKKEGKFSYIMKKAQLECFGIQMNLVDLKRNKIQRTKKNYIIEKHVQLEGYKLMFCSAVICSFFCFSSTLWYKKSLLFIVGFYIYFFVLYLYVTSRLDFG
jgi:hypothetical protein